MYGVVYFGYVPFASLSILTNESAPSVLCDGGGWSVKGYRPPPRKIAKIR